MKLPNRTLKVMLAPTIVAALGLVILSVPESKAQRLPAAPYTAAQAVAGRTIYATSCATCHAADLGGGFESPQLAGSNFLREWGDRTSGDLLAFIQSTMPPGNKNGLGEEAYLNVVAFILDANGARAGNQPLTASTKVAIRSVANGQVPAAIRPNRGGQTVAQVPAGDADPDTAPAGGGRRGGGARQPQDTATGVTVPGVIKNYVPVTDAMLLNPDPSDWLMIRHDYHASDYSPLNQITRDNARDLQLQWVWSTGGEYRRWDE